MAKALLERETLDAEEIEKLMKGETLPAYVAKAGPGSKPVTTAEDKTKQEDGEVKGAVVSVSA